MTRYSIEARTKRYGFLLFARNLSNKYLKNLTDTATKTGLDALKTPSKKVVDKAAEETGEFIGNKIAVKTMQTKRLPAENSVNVDEMLFHQKKKYEILSELRQVLQNGRQ